MLLHVEVWLVSRACCLGEPCLLVWQAVAGLSRWLLEDKLPAHSLTSTDRYLHMQYKEAVADLSRWLLEGKLQAKEDIVQGGLPEAPHALLKLFRGANKGKLIVKIAEPRVWKEAGSQMLQSKL